MNYHMNYECTKCLSLMFAMGGRNLSGVFMLQEAIASMAIEHGISFSEMAKKIYNHESH